MSRHGEDFSGGLVTVRDPAFLAENQLSECKNAVYVGGELSLYRCQGRALFASAVAGSEAVRGLASLYFSVPQQQMLVALAGTSLATASVALATGTFAAVEGVLAGTALEAIPARNGYVLLNGAGYYAAGTQDPRQALNRYWYWGHVASATATGTSADYLMCRTHGMLPVQESPLGASGTVVTATGAGVPYVATTGIWDYWTTEVFDYNESGRAYELESTNNNNPISIYVTSLDTGNSPVIVRPAQVNTNATHWCVYRGLAARGTASTATADQTATTWPAGMRIQKLGINSTSYIDGGSASSQGPLLPRAANDVFGTGFSGDPSNWGNPGPQWASAAALTATGATAYAPASAFDYNAAWAPPVFWQSFYDFNFTSFEENIIGVVVKVTARFVSAFPGGVQPTVWARIGPRNPVNGGFSNLPPYPGQTGYSLCPTKSVHASGGTGWQSFTFGGATDKWVPKDFAMTRANWTGGAWQVGVGVQPAWSFGSSDIHTTMVEIGGVNLQLYYGGSTAATGVLFNSVAIQEGGATAYCGEDGPPPVATTGDFFKGSLVLNSTYEPRLLRWSTPDKFDSFPDVYWLEVPLDRGDQVTAIRRIGRVCVVAGRYSLYRLNYLPDETDPRFERGPALDVLDATHGIVDRAATAYFTAEDGRTYLAYVSVDGVRMTDGYTVRLVTSALDWASLISASSLLATGSTYLANHITNHELRLYVARADGSQGRYHLNYHPNHQAAGNPVKVSGPVMARNWTAASGYDAPTCAASFRRISDGSELHLIGYATGNVYLDGALGATAAWSTADQPDSVTTRRMYLAGLSNEWKLNQVYLHGKWSGLTPTASVSGTYIGASSTLLAATSFTDTGNAVKLMRTWFRTSVEGASLSFCGGVGAWRLDSLVLDGEDFGGEDRP